MAKYRIEGRLESYPLNVLIKYTHFPPDSFLYFAAGSFAITLSLLQHFMLSFNILVKTLGQPSPVKQLHQDGNIAVFDFFA